MSAQVGGEPLAAALDEERRALSDSAGRVVRERYGWPGSAAPRVAGEGESAAQWREFVELGWLGTAIDDGHGGSGLPPSLASVLVEALAASAMIEPLASQLALYGQVLDACPAGATRDLLLADWLAGGHYGALARMQVRHAAGRAVRCTARGDHWRLDGSAGLVLDAGFAGHVLVAATPDSGAGPYLFALARDARGLVIDEHTACDGRRVADLALCEVDVTPAALIAVDAPAARALASGAVLFDLLLAAENLGLVRVLLRITHDYLQQREQFGRKLAEFQALQHRVADMYLAVVRLESLVELARAKLDAEGGDAAAGYVAAASAQAGVVGRAIGLEAVQLHGGIGMTDELVVGRYVKRLTVNELITGPDAQCARAAVLRGVLP